MGGDESFFDHQLGMCAPFVWKVYTFLAKLVYLISFSVDHILNFPLRIDALTDTGRALRTETMIRAVFLFTLG